ncbi:MAG TPA: type II toxin-antitoxin system HicB family antitoxin [Candidatus Kapabacteria bacterium]|jgi:predicted RNase H-like HicB family nuclease
MRADKYTAVIQDEDGGFVSLCPELDVASQGDSVEEALKNLKEAVELFLEFASMEEIVRRRHQSTFVTQFEAVHA